MKATHSFFIGIVLSLMVSIVQADEAIYQSRAIFPPQAKHVHGSSLVQLPNGDLLAAWFHGSGERGANDVVIQGSRLKAGADAWSGVFIMADTPNLPDCNPVLFLDRNQKLWLFWIAVRANGWQHALVRTRTTTDYDGDGAPNWQWQDTLFFQPGEEFGQELKQGFQELEPDEGMWGEYALPYSEQLIEAAKDKNKRQEGWMTRNHPLQLDSGRILLPLYSDGFNLSLAALSDDDGETWRVSKPIVSMAGIQPTFAQRKDGTIAAYMRETGTPPMRVQYSESNDMGESWSPARDTEIPNPSSSLQVRALKQSGHWVMIHNDSAVDRKTLAVALSDDEGKTWKWKRHIGTTEKYEYPSLIEGRDGLIHCSYTYKNDQGNAIRHDALSIDWIKQGD